MDHPFTSIGEEEHHIAPCSGESGRLTDETGSRHHLLRKPRRRGGLRRLCLAFCGFSVSLGCLAALAATGLFLWLKQGPIGFDLKPQIMAALSERIGHGYRFDLASTAVTVTEHGPTLMIDRLEVSDASARPVISAPHASISIDPLALISGKIAPRQLEVHDVDLRLLILPDGQVAVSTGTDGAAFPLSRAFATGSVAVPTLDRTMDPGISAPPHPADNAALRALAATMRTLVDATTAPDSALNALDHVSVTGRLVLDDRTHGTKTVFKDTVVSFDRASDGAATLKVAASGPAGPWALTAHASAHGDGSKLLVIEAKDLSLDEITLAGGLRSLGFDFDMRVSAHLSIGLGPDGEIATAQGTFSLGAGYFRLDDPEFEPMLIDSVTGGFHLDAQTNGIEIDRTELHAGGSSFGLTGHVDPPKAADGPWTVRAEASGVVGTERPGEKTDPHRASRSEPSLSSFRAPLDPRKV